VKLLLEYKANVNVTKREGPSETPLNTALSEKNEDIIKYLLKWNPNKENMFMADNFKEKCPDAFKILTKERCIECTSVSATVTANSVIQDVAYYIGTHNLEMYWSFKVTDDINSISSKIAIVFYSLEETIETLKQIKKGKKKNRKPTIDRLSSLPKKHIPILL